LTELICLIFLLPLEFADGKSLFRTPHVTEYLRTSAAVVEAFEVTIKEDAGREGSVRVQPSVGNDQRDTDDSR
jgi:hypothetical protein